MTATEFLQPDNEQIRHQIRGVLDSYSHEWDLLSEFLQNAVDAIREKNAGKGHITLLVDAAQRLIRVRDNGDSDRRKGSWTQIRYVFEFKVANINQECRRKLYGEGSRRGSLA